MTVAPRWVRLVRYLSLVVLGLLVLQYLLGLWTNLYAPSSGFTSSTSYPALNAHYTTGELLFLVGLVTLVVAALARTWRLIGPTLAVVVLVYLAGAFGRMFVSSSGNPPIDSFGMGAAFLLALFAAMGLVSVAWRETLPPSRTPPPSPVRSPTA